MKKLIMLLVMGIVAMGFTGCKEDTIEEKAKKDAENLKNAAEEKAEEIMKKTAPDITEEPAAIPVKPKDHPAH